MARHISIYCYSRIFNINNYITADCRKHNYFCSGHKSKIRKKSSCLFISTDSFNRIGFTYIGHCKWHNLTLLSKMILESIFI